MRKYLSDIRMEKNLSQHRVARESQISYQHYSRIEGGERKSKVSFVVMVRIAKALDIPLERMYRYEKEYLESIELSDEEK